MKISDELMTSTETEHVTRELYLSGPDAMALVTGEAG